MGDDDQERHEQQWLVENANIYTEYAMLALLMAWRRAAGVEQKLSLRVRLGQE
jgi:hypothetical protein